MPVISIVEPFLEMLKNMQYKNKVKFGNPWKGIWMKREAFLIIDYVKGPVAYKTTYLGRSCLHDIKLVWSLTVNSITKKFV